MNVIDVRGASKKLFHASCETQLLSSSSISVYKTKNRSQNERKGTNEQTTWFLGTKIHTALSWVVPNVLKLISSKNDLIGKDDLSFFVIDVRGREKVTWNCSKMAPFSSFFDVLRLDYCAFTAFIFSWAQGTVILVQLFD